MASFSQLSDMEALAPAGSASDLSGWLRKLGARSATCASTCADYYAAASLYEELRGLSDAELRNRGLSRDTLARDACETCDRSAGR